MYKKSTMYSVENVTDSNFVPVLQSNRYHSYIVNKVESVPSSYGDEDNGNDNGIKYLKDKMSDEKPVSSDTKTETKTVKNADGSTTTTITTTITDKFADGSTSTKTRIQNITEGIKPAGADGKNVTTYKGMDDIKERQSKAKKAPVTSSDKFLQDALKSHNNYRAKHGVKSLTLDKELCKVSQAWVNELAEKDKMSHSSNGYGENIFWCSGGELTGDDAVKSWYDEIKDFNWQKVEHQPGTGHFTQVVWKESEKLGIAYAKSKDGAYYVCANYLPAGNFLGQYKENVLPLK